MNCYHQNKRPYAKSNLVLTEMSSFHPSHGEISITLDDVSCLLHLPIRGKLLDHGKINKYDALKLMVDYLEVNPEASMKEFETTEGLMLGFDSWIRCTLMSYLEHIR